MGPVLNDIVKDQVSMYWDFDDSAPAELRRPIAYLKRMELPCDKGVNRKG